MKIQKNLTKKKKKSKFLPPTSYRESAGVFTHDSLEQQTLEGLAGFQCGSSAQLITVADWLDSTHLVFKA